MNIKVQMNNVEKEANGAPFMLKNFMAYKNDEKIIPKPTPPPRPLFCKQKLSHFGCE